MAHAPPSDFQKLAELEEDQNRIRDILFFQSIHGVSQSNTFGQGRKSASLGAKLGNESWFPLEAAITDIDLNDIATGVFDKLNLQSLANVIVGPAGTLILKTIQHVADGKIFSITPGTGRTVEITPGDNIEVASTITLTDKDMAFMQFFADTGKVKVVSRPATSAVPAGTADNDHLEWDNTGMVWVAQQFFEFGSGNHPAIGDLRHRNNVIASAFRNFADDGDVEIKLDTNDFLDITENNNGILNLRLRSQHAVNPDNQLLFTVGSGAGGVISIQSNLDLGIEIGASTIGIWKAAGLSLNDNNLEDVTEIHGRDDATPFKIVFDQAEDADTFISDDTTTADRINVTAGGDTFFAWVGGALPQVGLLSGVTGLLTISDQQFNAAARAVPADGDLGNDEINLYFDTNTDPGRWGFKRKTVGGVADAAIYVYSPMDFDLVMGTSNVIAGGSAKGVTNIGQLEFIDNLSTPGGNLIIYTDGTDVLVNTGSIGINLTNVIESPLTADLVGGSFDITDIEDYFLVRSDGTPRMAIIGGSGSSTQVLFDFVTNIDVRFTEALADVFELRMSDNTIRMHRNTNFETNDASNIGIASGTVATFGTVSGTDAVNMGSDDADAHSMFGYLAIRDKTAPGEPPAATEVRLFLDSVTGELSVFKFDGAGGNTVSLEGAGGNEFQDSLFRIFDDIDTSRKLAFQTGGIATGTTRTWTVPNIDGTIVLVDGATGDLEVGADVRLGGTSRLISAATTANFIELLAGGIEIVQGVGDVFRVTIGSNSFSYNGTVLDMNSASVREVQELSFAIGTQKITSSGSGLTVDVPNNDFVRFIPGSTLEVDMDDFFLRIRNTSTTQDPQLVLHMNDATPLDGALIGRIFFAGEDTSSNQQNYASIEVRSEETSSSNEEGEMLLRVATGSSGALFTGIHIEGGTGTQIRLGFRGATPQAPQPWNDNGTVINRTISDSSSTTDVRRALDTLIGDLEAMGLLG